MPQRAEAAKHAARIPTGRREWVEVRRIALFHADVARISGMRLHEP
jgi:hypothetical protein